MKNDNPYQTHLVTDNNVKYQKVMIRPLMEIYNIPP